MNNKAVRLRFALLLLTCIILSSCSSQRTNLSENVLVESQLEKDVQYLAQDRLEGREIGTPGEIKAALYLDRRYRQLGLIPMGDNQTFFQEFTITPQSNPHMMGVGGGTASPVIGRNVAGLLNKGSEYTIIIGAHFDHLGWGGAGSLYTGERAVHNGADDNASGVSALLAIASRLRYLSSNNNYLFVCFSGEEKGLWGSNYFTDHCPIPLDKINYMINLDMVGRLNEGRRLAINGVGTSPSWKPVIEKLELHDLSIVTSNSGVGPSDHTSFYTENIPALHFWTGQHEDYHRPSDDFEKINFEGIGYVVNYILAMIVSLDKDKKLVFTKTKDDSPADSRRKFNVTLGVIPDYLFSGAGMRIDGVREDRPAAQAGLQKGDVVIKMGDYQVENMEGYMNLLGIFEPGQNVKVIYVREDQVLETDVTF